MHVLVGWQPVCQSLLSVTKNDWDSPCFAYPPGEPERGQAVKKTRLPFPPKPAGNIFGPLKSGLGRWEERVIVKDLESISESLQESSFKVT